MSALALLSVLSAIAAAQPGAGGPPAGMMQATITGQVFDSDLSVPIEYANVVLYSVRDSQQVNGTITDNNGRFTLSGVRPGRFYVILSFIGYRDKTISDVQVAPGAKHDIGRVTLRQVAVAMEGVEATAERPKLEYRIDKKVVDVAHQPTPPTGTAVDALENVPSVKVDDDGNVTLRGSGSFKVLVDGRPSPLDGSEALQQIPASTIDNIEIVTNPSARYDASGPAGIVNVILKKQRQSGVSGIANLKGGLDGSYGGDFLLSYRQGIANIFAGADYNRRAFNGTRTAGGWIADTTGETTEVASHGSGLRSGMPWGIRAGTDLQLGQMDRLSLAGRTGRRSWNNSQQSNDTESIRPSGVTRVYTTGDTSSRGGRYYSASIDEVHNFGRQGHDLAAHVDYGGRSGGETSTNSERTAGVMTGGRRTANPRGANDLSLSLDYTRPLRSEDKFEAGYQGSLDRSRDSTSTWTFDTVSQLYVYDSAYSHVIAGSDDVHALYSTYTASFKPFGFEVGLRGEYSNRNIEMVDSARTFTVGGTDLFPSLHVSYALAEAHQLMASYTRRIERPGHWQLEPTLTWWNPHLVRRGNPDLKPEYIDSYEAGYQLPLGPSRLTLDGYYRQTHNKVEDVSSVYSPGVILRSVANVGTDHSLGAELLFDLRPTRWLGLNVSGDVYDYRVTGTLGSIDFASHSFNWEGNVSVEIRPAADTRVQVGARFSGPEATAQGTESGFFMTRASVRQQLFSRRLSINLQANDLLSTGGHGETSGGPGYDFYSHFRFQRSGTPTLSLGLTWNFNNFKLDRRLMQNDSPDEGGDPQQP